MIRTDTQKVKWDEWNPYIRKMEKKQMNYTSAMIQSWNKFCFTGGVIEVSVKLPGNYNWAGLWPAVWLMGNLGRATFYPSTEKIWPWSYDKCDGRYDEKYSQGISACNPNPGFGLNPHQGRGAPEIDIIEGLSGQNLPENYKVK